MGKTTLVALEVTDIHGNSNTCMVEVTVDDGLKPTLACPPNITLACSDYLDTSHLEIFGTVVTDPTKMKDVVVNNFITEPGLLVKMDWQKIIAVSLLLRNLKRIFIVIQVCLSHFCSK
ncbi:MAG: hypothetical protein IPJ39_13410 [Saprospiraceae bacterium]|nr:hypothetical protein [Saprospiraceae bacterium]